uniref:Negatively light-regulated protein n=1 Tax=Chlamydomonas euryale TaxID=1486919 RepID=A0A7R9V186_9CHLO|mmetsp:Transcript_1234/g.3312  ORF Transcript_1234/g.3312 Transcript_1234/m.3312 type:complete len:103 (+) Transcript_1234:136-444(+)
MADQGEGSGERSPSDIMKEQEAMLMAKYGGMKPKKKGGALGVHKEHKFFDSADWAMNKEAAAKTVPPGQPAPPPAEEALKPKLEPTPLPARRISHLDPMDKQ